MNNLQRLLARWLYIAVVTFSIGFVAMHYVRRSEWYKDRMYRELLQGDEDQRLHAATILALVGGERQLLEALRHDDPEVHSIARRGIEHLWLSAAGTGVFGEMERVDDAVEKKDFKEALRILDRVVARHPDFAEGWNRRGAVLWQSGEFARSIVDCQRALKLNPNHFPALQGLGICHLQLGEVDEAVRSLRQALKISPHDETTQRSLRRCEEFLRSHRTAGTQGRGTLL